MGTRILPRFRDDVRAGVAIMTAVSFSACLAIAGIVADTAIIYLHKRAAQSATDIAALVAAGEIDAAERAVAASLADNGFAGAEQVTVATGRYAADPDETPAGRFAVGAAPANAVHVRLASRAPVVLWPVLSGGEGPRLVTEAVAAETGVAGLYVGSRLASLQGGAVNAVLGALLGAEVNLSVMDYEALLDARVDLFDVLDHLAIEAGLAGATYSELLALAIGPLEVAEAMRAVLGATPGHAAAISALVGLPEGTGELLLGDLIDPGILVEAVVGGERAGLDALVSAFDILFAAARLANGESAVDVATGLQVGGLAGLDLRVVIGEPMQGTAWLEVGEGGTRVHTAQTRILLTARIGGTGPLSGAQLAVPLYVEAAAGTAELADISCARHEGQETRVTVTARPGLAHLWLGAIDERRLPEFGSDLAPAPARLVTTPLVAVDGFAQVEVANPGPETLVFTARDIADGRLRTAGTHAFVGPALGSLLGSAQITVHALGLGLGLPNVSGLVGSLLSTAAAPLDSTLASLLRTAGVGLGELDVGVAGVRCRGAALVH